MSNAQGTRMVNISRNAMKKDTCKLILHKFRQKEETADIQYEGQVAMPDESIENNYKCRDNHGRLVWTITPADNTDFLYLCDKALPLSPENPDFEFVSFFQVIEYPIGCFVPMHKDSADEYDTATSLIALDEDYTGGQLIVDDIPFSTKTGDMVSFNYSTETFHGTTPVKTGIRTVLAIWYQTSYSNNPVFSPPTEEEETTMKETEIEWNSTL